MIYPEGQKLQSNTEEQAHHPRVSIVMGTYNGGKYLREQLESIYQQTYKNIDVIVCDDCSTDNTVEILEEFSQEYGLVYQINSQNMGLVKNYEKALSLARGEYIALSDQDDIWYPGKIELLLNNIGPYSLIHSAVHVINGKGNPHGDVFVVGEYSRDHTAKVNFSDFLETAWVLGCTSLINRDLLEKCLPFPEGVMFHDWWLTMAAIKLGQGIKYIHKPTIRYRQYGENTAFKFFTDISWHRKRYEFYQLLAVRFHGLLTLQEEKDLADITQDNAVQFILMGIGQNQTGEVEQFLQKNKDLLTLPFIKKMISTVSNDIEKNQGSNTGAQETNATEAATSQFIHDLRVKLYTPKSRTDKIISMLYRSIFRPLILIPARKIYLAIRSRGRH
jgi:glycosyltransferase involved in cell wall biosynthesis